MSSSLRRITHEGSVIAFRDRGRGVPILFIHGTGLSSRYWSPVASSLAIDHRTLIVDLLGYGQSSSPASGDNFHIDEDRDAVLAVLSSLNEPAFVVGHSYGGLLALRGALANPTLFRGLVLYEPVAFSVLRSANHEKGQAELNDANRGGAITEGRGDEAWLRHFVDYWNGKGAFDAMTGPAREALIACGKKASLEVRSNLSDRTSHEIYATIDIPTLIVHGERSPLAARATAEILVAHMPRARAAEIAGAGHLGPFTHGDDFERLLVGFLGER